MRKKFPPMNIGYTRAFSCRSSYSLFLFFLILLFGSLRHVVMSAATSLRQTRSFSDPSNLRTPMESSGPTNERRSEKNEMERNKTNLIDYSTGNPRQFAPGGLVVVSLLKTKKKRNLKT
jgi:hypothetical protein